MNGFVKLFQSIVSSSVWRAPDHVRLVWITMLALKDMDGKVNAAIPGLAAMANVSIEQTENALRILMSPDPYSRTKDHEGRRLAEIDGGWYVLNHQKYKDLLNAEDRRERDRRRKADERGAPRTSADERGRARTEAEMSELSPHTYTDPNLLPVRGSDQAAVSASSDPSQEPGLDHDHSAPGVAVAHTRQSITDLVNVFLIRINVARRELGDPRPITIQDRGGEGERNLRARLGASSTPGDDLAKVLSIAIAEARATDPPTLQWLSWSLANVKTWDVKLNTTLAEVEQRGGKRFSMGDSASVLEMAKKIGGGS